MRSSEDTMAVLARAAQGDSSAREEVWSLVYDELRGIAAACLNGSGPGHTLQPTALVHEAYVRLMGEYKATFESRSHFMALAAKVMRAILVDHARARQTLKRGGGLARMALHADIAAAHEADVDVLELDGVLTKLAAMDERLARVVELRFFGGLSIEQVAAAVNVTRSTVAEDWRLARAWLVVELRKAAGDGRA